MLINATYQWWLIIINGYQWWIMVAYDLVIPCRLVWLEVLCAHLHGMLQSRPRKRDPPENQHGYSWRYETQDDQGWTQPNKGGMWWSQSPMESNECTFPSPVKWLFYLISNCPHDYFMKGIERILKVINWTQFCLPHPSTTLSPARRNDSSENKRSAVPPEQLGQPQCAARKCVQVGWLATI